MSDEPDFSTRVRCLVELYHAEENVQKDLDDTLALKRELVKFLPGDIAVNAFPVQTTSPCRVLITGLVMAC